MSRQSVARTYADTLLTLAERSDGAADDWLAMLGEVAELYRSSGQFRAFLHTPRVTEVEKARVLRETFHEQYPEPFVRFLLVLLQKRRQGLLPEIETEARDMLFERTGRLHASVTLAREPDAEFVKEVERHLSRVFEREVDAEFRVDPRLIGGMVVRAGDRVLDGSVRRRFQALRRSLLDNHTQSVG